MEVAWEVKDTDGEDTGEKSIVTVTVTVTVELRLSCCHPVVAYVFDLGSYKQGIPYIIIGDIE